MFNIERLSRLRATLQLAQKLAGLRPPRAVCAQRPWRPGLSILIPDRDSPALLAECLSALQPALHALTEPIEVIVSCSDAAVARYASVNAAFPAVRWLHSTQPLGYARAIQRGLGAVRYDHVYLLNNDVTLDPHSLSTVMAHRGLSVFAVSSQILFADGDRRREETGLTAAYGFPQDMRIYDVEPGAEAPPLDHLYAGGGASLFRTEPLRRYVNQATAYDPVYWEDVEWGWRAAENGWRICYCAESIAVHRHRATVNRVFQSAEIDRIIARNALQFRLRNIGELSVAALLEQFSALPLRSQRELTSLPRLASLLRRRSSALKLAAPSAWFLSRHRIDIQLGRGNTGSLPTLICVTPFALLPTTHGGARRTLELLKALRLRYSIVLVSDEADLYPPLAIKQMPWLSALMLVSGRDPDRDNESGVERRQRHAWPGIVEAVAKAHSLYPAQRLLISHEELVDLIELRQPDQHWTLDLHDVHPHVDQQRCADYDAVLATSAEDLALLTHRRAWLIANGSRVNAAAYQPSVIPRQAVLFVGNLRYPPNRAGLLAFIAEAWPQIRQRCPQAQLHLAGIDTEQAQQLGEVEGLVALGEQHNLAKLYADATLTICPLQQIRGSALKIVESLAAGRICVATNAGARGHAQLPSEALVRCESVLDMGDAVAALLVDADERHRRERPSAALLQLLSWDTQADKLDQLWANPLTSADRPEGAIHTPVRLV